MMVSVQTGGMIPFWGAEDGYRMIREAGFDGIDWGLDESWTRSEIQRGILSPCVFTQPLDKVYEFYREELEQIEKNGLSIVQAHAPFPPYVKDFPALNDYAVEVYRQCIRFCDSLDIPLLVIHGISLALDDRTQTRASVDEMNRRLYEGLIPVLREGKVTVCLENLFTRYGRHIVEGTCSDPHSACALIDSLNGQAGREAFAFCVDTGHLNIVGKDQRDYIHVMGGRIKAVHLHDNWGDDDRHLAPYAGDIVWRDVIDGLRDIGYRGSMNFETHQQVALSRVDRDMVPILLRAICETGRVFSRWMEYGAS